MTLSLSLKMFVRLENILSEETANNDESLSNFPLGMLCKLKLHSCLVKTALVLVVQSLKRWFQNNFETEGGAKR